MATLGGLRSLGRASLLREFSPYRINWTSLTLDKVKFVCQGNACKTLTHIRTLSCTAIRNYSDHVEQPAGDQSSDVQLKTTSRFQLPFEEYQKLKRSVRSKQRIAGIPFAFVGLGTSSVLSAYMFPDMFDATPENVQLILGLDPLVFCGICGVLSCGLGYIAGTSLFGATWKWMNKDLAHNMELREKDFLERLQAQRFSDFNKFEDDYYGESIKTLGDYRQWLRTQQKKSADAKKYLQDNKAKEQDDEGATAELNVQGKN